MLSREETFKKARGTKRTRKSVRDRSGDFPKMDKKLAAWVRETRSLGIPVESFMLEIEGRRIMKECYPSQFESDGECKFKFTGG